LIGATQKTAIASTAPWIFMSYLQTTLRYAEPLIKGQRLRTYREDILSGGFYESGCPWIVDSNAILKLAALCKGRNEESRAEHESPRSSLFKTESAWHYSLSAWHYSLLACDFI
jgi:hypothetical protein